MYVWHTDRALSFVKEQLKSRSAVRVERFQFKHVKYVVIFNETRMAEVRICRPVLVDKLAIFASLHYELYEVFK